MSLEVMSNSVLEINQLVNNKKFNFKQKQKKRNYSVHSKQH